MLRIDESANLRREIFADLKHLALSLLGPRQDNLELPLDVRITRITVNSVSNRCFEKALVGLTLQGRKTIRIGQRDIALSSEDILATCVDLPSVSTITEASTSTPYLSVYCYLNHRIMADLLLKAPEHEIPEAASPKIWSVRADNEIADTFRRLLHALTGNEDGQLAELLLRELYCQLLNMPQSGLMRQLNMAEARDSRISEVIRWLRSNLNAASSIDFLATMANMSVSTFHRYFKHITGLSPLQYQKQLRLYEAQRLMLAECKRASEAALAVGYESITQFNREYRRLFGEPPGRDMAKRRKNLNEKTSSASQPS